MTTGLLVMVDGRKEYVHQTLASADSMLMGPIIERWIHDDSGDEEYRQWLRLNFPEFTSIGEGPRRGFGGAYAHAWKILREQSEASFLFGLEDDFIFNREIPLEAMAKTLNENSNVYQMALRRQAWSSDEMRAGGVMERLGLDQFHQEDGWISHRIFWTTNPSLYRRSLIETRSFPNVKDAEGHFFQNIINTDPDAIFGYWGLKTDPAWVEHIGVKRKGDLY